MKKILITNDDGIASDGLLRLVKAASHYGEVWVVAPDGQRSAYSHSITLREAIDLYPVDYPVEGVHAYKISGTPADCVRLGIPNILKDMPDYVFTGINYGYNIGTDVQYSATVGSALEAASMGGFAIAFSEEAVSCHEVCDAYLEPVMEELMALPLQDNQIWNVNFPGCKLDQMKGILRERSVARNAVFDDHYLEEELPDGGRRLRVHGIPGDRAEEGTDFRAVMDHYISIGKINNLK